MPSGPWPWIDFGSENFETVTSSTIVADASDELHWEGYPQNRFQNWTADKVGRSKILTSCSQSGTCSIYRVDVMSNGKFRDRETFSVQEGKEAEFWKFLKIQN